MTGQVSPSAPPWHAWLNWDLIAITTLSVIVAVVVLGTWTTQDLTGGDGPWYLNRSLLLWQGIVDDGWMYTVFYPVVVGAVNLLVRDLILAKAIIHLLLLVALITGTYLLGRSFYGRATGWLSAVLVLTHPFVSLQLRQLESSYIFLPIILWCVLLFRYLVLRPGTLRAVLLGGLLAISIFARLEGLIYGILIPLAGWQILRTTRDRVLALRVFLISGSGFAFGAGLYFFLMMGNANLLRNQGLSLPMLLGTTPVSWYFISWKLTDTLTAVLALWPLWAWWIVVIGAFWDRSRFRTANWALLCMILPSVFIGFVVSVWPGRAFVQQYLPLFAIVLAGLIWRFAVNIVRPHARRVYAAVIVVGLMVAVSASGLRELARYSQLPWLGYRDSQLAQDAAAVEQWLDEQGIQDTQIYTFCGMVVPFSQYPFHIIYRLALERDASTPNSPTGLLPRMREQGQLFMRCNEPVYYEDWKDYFRAPDAYEEQLEVVGTVRAYTFYRVVHVE